MRPLKRSRRQKHEKSTHTRTPTHTRHIPTHTRTQTRTHTGTHIKSCKKYDIKSNNKCLMRERGGDGDGDGDDHPHLDIEMSMFLNIKGCLPRATHTPTHTHTAYPPNIHLQQQRRQRQLIPAKRNISSNPRVLFIFKVTGNSPLRCAVPVALLSFSFHRVCFFF